MYIARAAIKYPDGEIVVANRHYKIVALQAKLGVSSNTPECVQGFIDTSGNFYTREEAKEIAIKSGQLSSEHKGVLYSEDLWPDPLEKMI